MTQANPEGGVELREVTEVLCAQWSAFLGTRARVLRWLLERDERPWLDAFLRSRLERFDHLPTHLEYSLDVITDDGTVRTAFAHVKYGNLNALSDDLRETQILPIVPDRPR